MNYLGSVYTLRTVPVSCQSRSVESRLDLRFAARRWLEVGLRFLQSFMVNVIKLEMIPKSVTLCKICVRRNVL
jgi:hypothetical protein